MTGRRLCTPPERLGEDLPPLKETDQSACYSQRPSRASSSFPRLSEPLWPC